MGNREEKVRFKIFVTGFLLVIGFLAPIVIVSMGKYISEINKEHYFQFSCLAGALCSYFSQQSQSKAFNLLCPKSAFDPPECFGLREKYRNLVLKFGAFGKFLIVITIILGVLGSYIAQVLIQNGLY
ncbi:hypothetical protein F7U70_001577 [Vibrio fluvialis]|uniref:hypothetical protein n=1 Tax=Vibrio fluvialis TaxID=676 RepID=UPI001C9D521F|nr:hypothetical protein [Vibrio fluvialis]EKO3942699.1 hypothetical protein [Vibrio fluvialis]ELD1796679.1 hypothetical protein [Vibrio fluvialis]MBY7933784.1 hypothetical protein [Vibrio fluvialis]MBY8268081.1 hypothetical protein [Vibrio fluvialis]MCE7581939.1 hypothetical protein [Vibrio fluvialis]